MVEKVVAVSVVVEKVVVVLVVVALAVVVVAFVGFVVVGAAAVELVAHGVVTAVGAIAGCVEFAECAGYGAHAECAALGHVAADAGGAQNDVVAVDGARADAGNDVADAGLLRLRASSVYLPRPRVWSRTMAC